MRYWSSSSQASRRQIGSTTLTRFVPHPPVLERLSQNCQRALGLLPIKREQEDRDRSAREARLDVSKNDDEILLIPKSEVGA